MLVPGIVASGYDNSPPIGPSTTATITFNVAVDHPTLGTSTTWNWPADGDIILLANSAERTFTTDTTFTATTKLWGGSGGPSRTLAAGSGGGGGAAVADITFEAGVTYRMVIGLAGATQSPSVTIATANWLDPPSYISGSGRGGSINSRTPNANGAPGNGGGYTGIFHTTRAQANALLIAGGGGGAGAQSNQYSYAGRGGAGGGTTGQNGAFANAPTGTGGANGATQSAGGAGDGGNAIQNGTALQGGHTRTNSAPLTSYGVGGGGGGGYWGGGAAGGSSIQGGSGGGGGSGRASSNTSRVNNATLYSGDGRDPGNAADPDRGAIGNFASATWGNIAWGAISSTYSSRGNGFLLIKYPG